MTVASPTTGTPAHLPHDADVLLSVSACPRCRSVSSAGEPFCAHCGSRLAVATRTGLASVAATRSLQFALLAIAVNILVGGASFGVVYLLSDSARISEAALGLEAMRFVIIGALVAVAIVQGVRGLRQTRDGMLRRRPWAIAGITVAGFYGLLTLGSFAATALLFLAL